MAYLLNEEEEEQQNQQQTPLLQNQSQMQGMGGGQNVLIRPSRMGTGFTNISQFLEANRQAGQQLTNRVVGNVQKDTAKATSGIQDVRQKVEDTRQSKKAWETDANKIQAAIEKAKDTSKAENLTDLENLVQGPQLDRTLSIMRGNTNVNELGEQFRTAAANLGANLTAQETSLEQGLGRELGRMGLVRRAIKSPTYTVGQMALDQTIMEGMGSQDLQSSLIQNRAQIGQTRQEALNLSEEQKQLANIFSSLAQQKAQELQELQKNTVSFTNQQIDQQKAQAEAEIAEYEGLVKKILSGELSVDQIYSILNPNYRPRSAQGISEKPTTGEIDPKWTKFFKTDIKLDTYEVPRNNTLGIFKDPNLQKENYRKAVVDKFLRENFGLDTNTRLFNLDPTSLVNVSREGLRDKVTTTNQVRLLNALERLMAGETAKQLSLEGRDKTALDIIDHGKFGQKTQQALNKELFDFLSRVEGAGTITGHGQASEHTGGLFGRWVDEYAAYSNSVLAGLAHLDPELIKQAQKVVEDQQKTASVSSNYSDLAGGLSAGLKDISNFIGSFGGLLPGLTNNPITSSIFGRNVDRGALKQRAMERAFNQYLDKVREVLDQNNYNRKFQLGKKKG